jgi:polyphosphate kinase
MLAESTPAAPAALVAVPAGMPGVPPATARIDRELALIAFNRRVLAMAIDPEVPLLERLRYLCIVGNNLDEFFEIRVAGLRQQLHMRAAPADTTLPQLRARYTAIAAEAHALVDDQYRLLEDDLLPALAAHGVRLLSRADGSPALRAWTADYFARNVRPLLTPIGLDPSHPLPQIVNKSLNFIVALSGQDAFGRKTTIALVKAPRVLPRVIKLPVEVAGADNQFLLLSSIMHAHLGDLFAGRDVLAYSQFRLTRDADLSLGEEDVKNLRDALAGELPQRQFGLPLRLEVAANCPDDLSAFLLNQFALGAEDLYRCNGPVNIVRLASMIDEIDIDALKFPPFVPARSPDLPVGKDILGCIRARDVLLHHPYQSFDPVVEFIRRAADDPEVVAIKQTVYRTGVNSALMEALVEAAHRGKEVTVIVELMARFDEETNINWAERLEAAGAQVVYGVFGLKTHAKLALMFRRERDARGEFVLVPYAHLGTGNYHPRTTRLYSDFGLLTADRDVCADINEIFAHITSLARAAPLRKLMLAPFTMHARVLELIRREAQHARDGRPARIRAKMNALVDDGVIDALQEASQAGVPIDLVVRGACALRPGVPGVSDNIRVRSILGRFLEHHRVWHFANDGRDDVWLASADWMGRNFFRRIEVAFPVDDPALKARVLDEGLDVYLRDNCNAWTLDAAGGWTKVTPGAHEPFCAQQELLARFRTSPEIAALPFD